MANLKSFGSLPAPQAGYATTIMFVFFFAYLLISEYPDHHQNVIVFFIVLPRTPP